MYKALFYHKQDIFVWGILGLYHIRLIKYIIRKINPLKVLKYYDRLKDKQMFGNRYIKMYLKYVFVSGQTHE